MQPAKQRWYPTIMTGGLALRTPKTAIFNKFKYYIHDKPSGYSFEMLGPFTESAISELECCWKTAKTTNKSRTLILDVRGITFVDEKAKQWLASMHQEGAKYLPDTFLLDTLAGQPGRQAEETPRRRWFPWFERKSRLRLNSDCFKPAP